MIKEFFRSERMKSFLWRAAMMFVAGFCNVLGDSLVGFHLTPEATTVLGLILGEVSKAINNSIITK